MTAFGRERIEELLRALDRALARRGATADVYLVGGAAIALSFDAARKRRTTSRSPSASWSRN